MEEFKKTLRLLVQAQLERLGLYEEIRKGVNEIIQEAVLRSLKEMAYDVGSGTKKPEPPVRPVLPEKDVLLDEAVQERPIACYVYGIVQGEALQGLGPIGIEGAQVYSFPAGEGLSAVIHHCTPEAYDPPDDETAKKWLFTHQEVLERVQEKFGGVLPMGFNNIVFVEGQDPREAIKTWVAEKGEYFSLLLQRLAGKQEFGVKVLVEEDTLKKAVLEEDEHLHTLRKEMESKSEGLRYMYREKLERAVQEALEQKATAYFKGIYETIRGLCADVQVERTRKPPGGKYMVASLSCLVAREKVEQLGQVLSDIDRREGFSVDFTGPWPPYSFVGDMKLPLTR